MRERERQIGEKWKRFPPLFALQSRLSVAPVAQEHCFHQVLVSRQPEARSTLAKLISVSPVWRCSGKTEKERQSVATSWPSAAMGSRTQWAKAPSSGERPGRQLEEARKRERERQRQTGELAQLAVEMVAGAKREPHRLSLAQLQTLRHSQGSAKVHSLPHEEVFRRFFQRRAKEQLLLASTCLWSAPEAPRACHSIGPLSFGPPHFQSQS